MGMPLRAQYLVDEIKKVSPDILCLQEVKNYSFAEGIADKLGMNYFFSSYEGEEEGICILSKDEIKESVSWMCDGNAQYVCVEINHQKIGIVNLHLPWENALLRERCILAVLDKLQEKEADFVFLMGDFNCGDNSDVIRVLIGDCSLQGKVASPCFYDLSIAYAMRQGVRIKDTLDFCTNPRFRDNTIEVNQRYDRIFLQNTYPREFPRLSESDIFGTEVYEQIGLAASDHYGVYAKLNI